MTDRQIVAKLILNDNETIKYFFFVRCKEALTYIGRYYLSDADKAEDLIGEFYVYLSADNWHKLRIFNFKCSLNSYISIIASRYFKRKCNDRMIHLEEKYEADSNVCNQSFTGLFMEDLNAAIDSMKPLDRFLLKRILVEGNNPRDILSETHKFIDNDSNVATDASDDKKLAAYVYTRYNRARNMLKQQMVRLGYGI